MEQRPQEEECCSWQHSSVLWRSWPGGVGGLEGKEGCQAPGGRVAGEWEEMDGLGSGSLSGGMWVSYFTFVTSLSLKQFLNFVL